MVGCHGDATSQISVDRQDVIFFQSTSAGQITEDHQKEASACHKKRRGDAPEGSQDLEPVKAPGQKTKEQPGDAKGDQPDGPDGQKLYYSYDEEVLGIEEVSREAMTEYPSSMTISY